jgi:hypothetical protein
MANSIVEAMERMFNERIPTDRRRAPRHQYEESGGENLMRDMTFMTVSKMDVVVEGGLVIMAGMEDELMGMVVTTVCVLKMKNLMTLIMKRGLMIMKILLQMVGCLIGVEIIAGMLIMKIGSIIMVVIIGMTRTILLVSS